MKSAIALGALSAFAPTADAACMAYNCTDTISMLIVEATGVSIRLTGDLAGLTNCTPVGGVYLRLSKTDPNYASQFALLLAARFAGQSITVRTIDNSPDCSISYTYVS